jgi:penicillin amidase
MLRRVLVGLAAALLAVLAVAAGVVWETLPGAAGTLALPGLTAPVEVGFDADGIPRIGARNEADAVEALGFLHARERMFQMDLTRRAAAGEVAELIGRRGLRNDRLMRTLGVRRSAEADLAILPADTRALLDAYARGVNAWIARRGRFAGLEYLFFGAPRPWSAVDCLLWGKMMTLYLSGNWTAELARAALVRRLPPEVVDALWPGASGGAGHPEAALAPGVGRLAARLAAVIPRFPDPFTLPGTASDEWAVDGRFSNSGSPMLAGDPHLGFAMPGTWYLARIDLPGAELAGATAPGLPFMVLGHNARIAWTFTNTGADVEDLFVEAPAGPGEYMAPDGPRPFAIHRETIHVRGAPDETITVRETRHGPVISDLVAPGGPLVAIAMAGLAPGDTAASGLLAINRAQDRAAAGKAAALLTSPVQNLLVADRAGIALYVTGRVPIRRAGDGDLPARGDDGSHDWTGFASGDALPHYVTPDSGRLVNGNERIAPPDFPVFLGRDWFGDWRARRIRELLAATPRHTLASFAAMQVDTVSLLARDLLPRLLRTAPADDLSRAALALLPGWSGAMDADQPQPLIFNAWMQRYRRDLLARFEIPESAAVPHSELIAGSLAGAASPLCGGSCDALLTRSLAEAMAATAARFGDDPAAWRWGAAHKAVFAHPLLGEIPLLRALAARRVPSPGDDTTLFRAGMGGNLDAIHGASFRAVYDLADLERSRFVVAPGQSGNIASRLAWNFVRRWRAGDTITLTADPPIVSRLSLMPEPAP